MTHLTDVLAFILCTAGAVTLASSGQAEEGKFGTPRATEAQGFSRSVSIPTTNVPFPAAKPTRPA